VGGEIGQRAPTHLLEQLGQLAGDDGIARTERIGHVGERGRQPLRRFQQHERRRYIRKLLQLAAACSTPRREETREQEAHCRQAGHAERGKRGRCARNREQRQPSVDAAAHQAVARVGNERRARIGHQSHSLPPPNPLDQGRPRRARRVFVIAYQWARDAMDGEQLGGDTGVLAGDHVGLRKHVESAQRDIGGVADRRRNQIEAGPSGGKPSG
jgi:hypothetical protein